nr:hypothetical protein [Mesorhizobium waimense]
MVPTFIAVMSSGVGDIVAGEVVGGLRQHNVTWPFEQLRKAAAVAGTGIDAANLGQFEGKLPAANRNTENRPDHRSKSDTETMLSASICLQPQRGALALISCDALQFFVFVHCPKTAAPSVGGRRHALGDTHRRQCRRFAAGCP